MSFPDDAKASTVQPKYVQVAQRICAEIRIRDLKSGDRLPSRQELRQRWRVANDTVDMAIRHLIEAGVLVARRGSGTFVEALPLSASSTAALLPTLDVLIPHTRETLEASISPHTFLARLDGIGRACDELGAHCRLRLVNPSEYHALEGLLAAVEPLHDGVILFQHALAARLVPDLKRRGRPFVILGQTTLSGPVVRSDWEAGYREAFVRLAPTGCRRAAYLGENPESPYSRVEALSALLKEAQMDLVKLWWAPPGDPTPMYQAALDAAARGEVDLILTRNDFQALALLDRLGQAGLRVPQDIGVLGYDDIAATGLRGPGLSTIHVPFEAEGCAGVKCVLEAMSKGAVSAEGLSIPTRFVERGTTQRIP